MLHILKMLQQIFCEADTIYLETVIHYGLNYKLRACLFAAYLKGVEDTKVNSVTTHDSEPMNFKLGLRLDPLQ